MSSMQPLFRTAALGGFQKQDVLDYIETVGREPHELTESLRTWFAETEERISR